MRVFSIVFLFITLGLNTWSQAFESGFSTNVNPLGSKKEFRFRDVLASSQYGVYLHKSQDGVESIVLVNNEGDISAEKEFATSIPNSKYKRELYQVFVEGEKLIVVYEFVEKKLDYRKLDIEMYNASNLDFIKTIHTQENPFVNQKMLALSTAEAPRIGEAAEEDFGFSPDGNKFAFYVSPFSGKGDSNESLVVSMFNASGELAWSADYSLTEKVEDWDFQSMIVTNSGDVFIMYTSRFDIFSREVAVDRKLVQISNGGEEIKVIDMPAELKSLRGLAWDVREDGKLEFYGYVNAGGGVLEQKGFQLTGSSPFKNGAIAGCEILVFNPLTETLEERASAAFTEELMRAVMNEREENKMERAKEDGKVEKVGLNNLKARELIKNADGSVYLVGEEYYTYVVTTSTPNGGTTSKTMHELGDIVIMKIDRLGNLLWNTNIPRAQLSSDVRYLGFVGNWSSDGLTFYFNDHKDNCIPEKRTKLKTYKSNDGQIHLFKLSSDGVISEYALPPNENGYSAIKPSRTAVLPGGGIFFVESEGNQYYGRFIVPKN